MPALGKEQVSAREQKKSVDVVNVKKTPIHYPFWFGGSASCFAACFTHPLDLGMLSGCNW
jgi:dicarboxylate transporter 10